MTYSQRWDAENRLRQVTIRGSNQSNSFVYDGDGQRVQKVEGTRTTAYVGQYYERSSDTAASFFAETFEGDTSRWSLSGLWHVTSSKSNSPTHSAWYGQESTGNYATGSRTTGNLQVTLAGVLPSNAVLSFNYFRQVESYAWGAYDQTSVQISTNGGSSWTTLFALDSRNGSDSVWHSSGSLSLAAYAGAQNALLRFVFDSVDGYANNYAGWYIDDVSVSYPTTSTTSYYYAGGKRVAMKQDGTVYYLHGDQLGSTSLTTLSSGAQQAQQRYGAYGLLRTGSGVIPTDYRFTGQRRESLGNNWIYDYGARFYDALIGRFLSADSIVPGASNPQALNRYSYVFNNPLKYVDPSGHDLMIVPGYADDNDYEVDPSSYEQWIRAYKGWKDDEAGNKAWKEFIIGWRDRNKSKEQLKAWMFQYGVHIFDWSACSCQNQILRSSQAADVMAMIPELKRQMQGLKDITLIGHSKGGNLVLNYLKSVGAGDSVKNAVIIEAPKWTFMLWPGQPYSSLGGLHAAIPMVSSGVRVVNISNPFDVAATGGWGEWGIWGAINHLDFELFGSGFAPHSIKAHWADYVLHTDLQVQYDQGAGQ